ncbi:MAG TPA: hypothetical protein DEH78_04135 [Solibacterales bacterium]|nr:hypothetical protein [Bryobacterales bacterium]
MSPVAAAAALLWILYIAIFVRNWLGIRRSRRRDGERWDNRKTDRTSRRGLLLQGLGLLCALVPAGATRPSPVLQALALALLLLGLGLVWLALRHLGDQWRVNAVVTEDHRLVTTGPYALVRHPIYTSLFAMTLGTAILVTSWALLAAAVLFYSAGSEIRVRSEDALLAAHFGPRHAAWRSQTKAWLPWIR